MCIRDRQLPRQVRLAEEAVDAGTTQPPSGNVVEPDIAEDRIHGLIGAEILRLATDHDRDLGFVMKNVRLVRWQNDRVTVARNTFGGFEEQVEPLKWAGCAFPIVPHQADNFRRSGQRGIEARLAQWRSPTCVLPALQLRFELGIVRNQVGELILRSEWRELPQ